MRLGYNTNGFAHHGLGDALEIISEIGYRAVALTPDVHHLSPFECTPAQLVNVRRRLQDLELVPVVETGARFVLDPRRKHRPTLLDDEAEGRELRLRFLVRCAQIASQIGARQVSIWSGRIPEGVSHDEAWGRLEAGVSRLCERAAELGIGVAFEPEPGMFVESLAGWEQLHRRVGSEVLGLTLDVGHVPCCEPISPADAILRYGAQLRNVHLDDMRGRVHDHLQIGEGDLDFHSILDALTAVAYEGVASVELSRHSHAAPEAARVAWERLDATRGRTLP